MQVGVDDAKNQHRGEQRADDEKVDSNRRQAEIVRCRRCCRRRVVVVCSRRMDVVVVVVEPRGVDAVAGRRTAAAVAAAVVRILDQNVDVHRSWLQTERSRGTGANWTTYVVVL